MSPIVSPLREQKSPELNGTRQSLHRQQVPGPISTHDRPLSDLDHHIRKIPRTLQLLDEHVRLLGR